MRGQVSRQKLAAKTGSIEKSISWQYIQRLEVAREECMVSIEVLQAICTALDTNVENLFTSEDGEILP